MQKSDNLIRDCFGANQNGIFDGDMVTAWGFLEDTEIIYNDILSLNRRIGVVIDTQKFESEKTVQDYKEIQNQLESKTDELGCYAKELRNMNGVFYTDAEYQTISQMNIFR